MADFDAKSAYRNEVRVSERHLCWPASPGPSASSCLQRGGALALLPCCLCLHGERMLVAFRLPPFTVGLYNAWRTFLAAVVALAAFILLRFRTWVETFGPRGSHSMRSHYTALRAELCRVWKLARLDIVQGDRLTQLLWRVTLLVASEYVPI